MVAVEAGVKPEAAEAVAAARRALTAQPEALQGLSRVYTPKDDVGETQPSQGNRVQINAEDVLTTLAGQLTRLFDVTLTKEAADTQARADVVVTGADGKPFTLLSQVPVTYLLFLEKQLTRLEGVLAGIPQLDPATEWVRDQATGLWRSAAPVRTVSNKKTYQNHVKFAGDANHPPQVEVYTEDVPVGYWDATKFSGAVPAQRVQVLVERCRDLKRAVLLARDEANSIAVTDQRAGDKVFGYLFA